MPDINVVVIIVSDRSFRGEREDLSGPAVCSFVSSQDWNIIDSLIISDDLSMIVDTLRKMLSREETDLILTCGGTGLSPRDNTPEATNMIIEKPVPGLTEYMRFRGIAENPNAILSRAVAGIACGKLIINLPGSPKGAVQTLQAIADVIPHAIGILKNQEFHSN